MTIEYIVAVRCSGSVLTEYVRIVSKTHNGRKVSVFRPTRDRWFATGFRTYSQARAITKLYRGMRLMLTVEERAKAVR
jgi:hypothetical protein